jgi:AraC family transcriptional regulator of adaptative response/methylated-DNA-[protein]-cysteine methyltransferase
MRDAPTKDALRDLLDRRALDAIAQIAGRTRRVLGMLVSLTFDADPQIGWRAVEAMGVAAARIADDDPNHVREHLRRLYWLLSEESGGICWRSPEAMAEIVSHRPTLFAEYIPIVASLLVSLEEEDLDHFRSGALWAIGRLGAVAGRHLQAVMPAVTVALDHPDSQVRGMAVWALMQAGETAPLLEKPRLRDDAGPVDLYERGTLTRTSVGRLVGRALSAPPDHE